MLEKEKLPDRLRGTVHSYLANNGYGYIRPDNREADEELFLVHRKSLRNQNIVLRAGERVTFATETVPRGTLAVDVYPEEEDVEESQEQTEGQEGSFSKSSQNLLAKAILARDGRDYETARRLYERGLKETPTVQLVLSYAAMEKNQNHKAAAMEVYRKGIARFPKIAKLLEDAGILAASMGQTDGAIDFLNRALKTCRETQQAGEKGVLLALARLYTKQGNHEALKKALEYFQAAQRVFGASPNLDASDSLTIGIIKVRIQHYRGDLTYRFIKSCGFTINRANLNKEATVAADLVVDIESQEISESYGISGNILVRCMFKNSFSQQDLDDIDKAIAYSSETDLANDQVAFLVLSSLPEVLQQALFRRVEDRKRLLPAIIPIPQETIETAGSGLAVFRDVLDKWLYRRDLFALNSPVVGKRFFGRDRTLAQLRECIQSGTAAGIFGLRKVGKTSLLKEIARRATETGDIVVYIDLLRVPADVTDTKWLYWRIANLIFEEISARKLFKIKFRLGGSYKDFLDIPENFPVATAFDSDLSQVLSHMRSAVVHPKPKIVLLLDEIERLLPTKLGKSDFVGFFDFFSYLRGVSQESPDFVVMVTGANPAIVEISQFGQRDNPVFNYFQEIYLQLLEFVECRTMMRTLGRGMGLSFDEKAIGFVYRMTGGHPFFTRELCSFVAVQFGERPLTVKESHVASVLPLYLEVAGKDFREILDRLSRDFPEERDVCFQLAKVGGPVPLHDLQRVNGGGVVSLRHLMGYQIVSIKDGHASLTMELFLNWLRDHLAI